MDSKYVEFCFHFSHSIYSWRKKKKIVCWQYFFPFLVYLLLDEIELQPIFLSLNAHNLRNFKLHTNRQ